LLDEQAKRRPPGDNGKAEAEAAGKAGSLREHLRSLTGRERASLLGAIERQLRHQPLVETRHRILAIGRKHGNALTIGGKEIQL